MRWLSLAALALCFVGCAGDGSFDAKGFNSAVGTVGNAYTTYDRSRNPQNYPPGYYAPSPPP